MYAISRQLQYDITSTSVCQQKFTPPGQLSFRGPLLFFLLQKLKPITQGPLSPSSNSFKLHTNAFTIIAEGNTQTVRIGRITVLMTIVYKHLALFQQGFFIAFFVPNGNFVILSLSIPIAIRKPQFINHILPIHARFISVRKGFIPAEGTCGIEHIRTTAQKHNSQQHSTNR